MRINYKFLFFILTISAFALMLKCAKETTTAPDPDTADTQPPSIFIEVPTTDISFVTTELSTALAGIAEDDDAIKEVRWTNSAGGEGNASGLENWSINNLPLITGDNTITVTATDMAGNSGSDEITITKNQYLVFLGRPFITPSGIFVNTPTNVTVQVTIAPNPNLIPSSVKLISIDVNNNILEELSQMYDDGDLQHGDDILGDGVFSTIFTFEESQKGEVRLRAIAETQETSGNVEGFSAIFSLEVFEPIKIADIQIMEETVDSALTRFKEIYETQNRSIGEAIAGTIDMLKTMPEVEDAYLKGSQLLNIEFKSGLISGILLAEVDDNGNFISQGGALVPDSTRRKFQKKISIAKQTIGNRNFSPDSKSLIDDDIILNKKVIIYEPFADRFFPANKGTDANKILEDSVVPFEITHLKNQQATVESLFKLTDFGYIIIDTHGFSGEEFVTGEKVNETSRAKYKLLRKQQKIFPTLITFLDPVLHRFEWEKVSFWRVNDKFIKGLDGEFPKSVVFNSSCESTLFQHTTFSLKHAFFSKKARTYLGVTQDATSGFLKDCLIDFTTKFAKELKTTGESFTPGRVESGDTPAEYEILGSKKMYYSTSLINGDFELGNLTGWSKDGDGRVISQLASLSPPAGNFMGIISTGLGQTTSNGSISQPFKVEQNQSNLTLEWNFLSEEFLEYINSQFQDFFKIEIINSEGQVDLIFNKTIDDIASDFSATLEDPGSLISVSPGIIFDQGDVYMTDWQSFSNDISEYQDQFITLIFSAGDVGDSAFDTAILLDNIIIQ